VPTVAAVTLPYLRPLWQHRPMTTLTTRLLATTFTLGLCTGAVGCKKDLPAGTQAHDVTVGGETLELSDEDGRVARVVHRPAEVPGAPAAGEFQVHLIDVGTGLAVLVRGADFTFLFDGGSNDDAKTGVNNRLLAYLASAIGPSSVEGCLPAGDGFSPEVEETIPQIDAIMVSHPHMDHASLLPDVLRCYEVGTVYDVGVINDRVFYRKFLEAVAEEPGLAYRTVVSPPSPQEAEFELGTVDLGGVDWASFQQGDVIPLGDGADLTVLAADGEEHSDRFNENSLVARLELGDHSVLLTGDAESGARLPPDAEPPPAPGLTEARLIEHHSDVIDVDILQVGHHGSMTSSRPAFIEAVSPTWALIGAGPRKYHGHRLPDCAVERMLEDTVGAAGGFVLNTDFDDGRCPVTNRIGIDDRGRSGGCTNYVLFLH
jgi:competence protein ComEC